MAGLVAAAVLASSALGGTIAELASRVGSNAQISAIAGLSGAGGGAGDGGTNQTSGEPAQAPYSPDQAGEVNALGQLFLDEEAPPSSADMQALRDAIGDVVEDPAHAAAIYELVAEGIPFEYAYAEATGDWSAIPGGDPASYSAEEQAVVLRMLGIELPPGVTAGGSQAALELLNSLPDSLISHLFTSGVQYDLNVTGPGIGFGPGLFSPVSASATVNIGASFALGDPQIGVGFGQTQSVEISTQVTAGIQASAGKNGLNTAYKYLKRLQLSGPLDELLSGSPLLRGVVKGLPFSVSYERFAGAELAYEATITTEQAAALANGDTTVLPNIYDPSTLQPGNSALIRGGDIEGSTFELKYKLVTFGETQTSFDGTGFGLTVLDDGRVAIYSGDIDAVERQNSLGIPGIGLVSSTSLTQSDFAYAELDLSTAEGQAAYDAFVSGGAVATHDDGPGVITATTDTLSIASSLGFQLDLGVVSATASISHDEGSSTISTFSDGSQTVVSTFGFGDAQVEIQAPVGSNGATEWEESTTTIVLADIDGNTVVALASGFNDSAAELPTHTANQHVQLALSYEEVAELQAGAQLYIENRVLDGPSGAEAAEPQGTIERLAAADNPEDAIRVLTSEAMISAPQLANDLQLIVIEQQDTHGRELGLLGGTVEFQDVEQ